MLPEARGLCPLGKANQIDTLADTVKPYGFDVDWSILSKELIDHCHARNIKVFSDALGLHETIENYRLADGLGNRRHPDRLSLAGDARSGASRGSATLSAWADVPSPAKR